MAVQARKPDCVNTGHGSVVCQSGVSVHSPNVGGMYASLS